MLPKKGRKEITVDNILYHYLIRGYVTVTIRNSVTGELFQHYEDWKPKWNSQMKPSDVELIIRKHKKNL
jgi:hypothetical protein